MTCDNLRCVCGVSGLPLQDNGALVFFSATPWAIRWAASARLTVTCWPVAMFLHRAAAGGNLILPQLHGVGDPQFIAVAHLLLKFLLFQVDLGADTRFPQVGGGGNGRAGGLPSWAGTRASAGGGRQGGIQQPLLLQHVKQPGQADGNAHPGQLPLGIVGGQIVIPAAGAHRANLRMIQQGGFRTPCRCSSPGPGQW